MSNNTLDIENVRAYWLTEAEEALNVMDHLVEKGDNSYALFFGHLAVEKMLKCLYVSRRAEHAPPVHNLLRLANMAGLQIDKIRADQLITITAFNIETRYPDLKRSFREKCSKEFTETQTRTIKEIFQWLRSLLP